MTCSTYTKKALVFHALYIVLLSAAGVLAAYSAVYTFSHISCREDVIAGGFTVFFALLLLSVDFFECRAMSAKLYVNEDGLGVRRFGKTKVFIRWDDIREIGTGSIPTPFGSKERVYFCDRMLEEGQRSDLITRQRWCQSPPQRWLYRPYRTFRSVSEAAESRRLQK